MRVLLYASTPIFLPLTINQCDIDNFFRTGTNGVHAPHPFHLIFDFKLFRNALLRCHLIY